MIGILIIILLTIHVIVCILLMLIVLMQRPRSEGLGTAFGSAVTESLFGSSAGNILTKITTWLAIIFFATTISLAYFYGLPSGQSGDLKEKLQKMSAAGPAEAAAPTGTNLVVAPPGAETPPMNINITTNQVVK